MELQFKRNSCSCLRSVLKEVQNMEQTQEIRIPEGMPGIDRVVSAWGQPIMRSKEWQTDMVSLSAGMMVWVLYISEEGKPQCVEGWIPFQLRWDLPKGCVDGTVRMTILPRYVDARSVSAGRIMVRAGIAALAEAWCPENMDIYSPDEVPQTVELLQSTYPVRLPKEAGERQFLLEEELILPGSAPVPERVIYHRMEPVVSDRKVLANKVVFRGNGNLHVLYESADGQLYSWDFELPISQFADLEGSYSQDAQVDVRLMPTNVELETDDEGKLHLKSAMTAQYVVDDREMLRLTEDAYSPGREISLRQEMLELPAVLDGRRENIYGEQTIPGDANLVVDTAFLPDFPRQRRDGDTITLDMPGMLQLLYYGADGSLQAASGRWAGQHTVKTDNSSQLSAIPMAGIEVQVTPGIDTISAKTMVPVQMDVFSGQGIPVVTGMEVGEEIKPDPGRPSLVIRRMENERLWDVAKENGSTMEAIRHANDLAEEPAAGRLLLIPVM